MRDVDNQAEIRDFLASRRARITPEQAGLPAYGGGNRRVKGLRREEVALLAGVSIDYYIRMERGNLAGASEQVLDSVADALQLDDAEREHLLAPCPRRRPCRPAPDRQAPATVRPVIQQVLDAITDAPAWVRNARHDILAMNRARPRALLTRPALRRRRRDHQTAAQHHPVHVPRPRRAGVLHRLRPHGHRRRGHAPPRSRTQPPRQGPHHPGRRAVHPVASCSGSTGRPTTSSSTAAAASGCATRQSANSTSTSRPWNCRPSPDSGSTSTPPIPTPQPLTDFGCSPPGPPPAPPRSQAADARMTGPNQPTARHRKPGSGGAAQIDRCAGAPRARVVSGSDSLRLRVRATLRRIGYAVSL